MPVTYYNEIDPYAAQWLRNLIKKGLIADGEVDTRSIVDVSPDDVRSFTQAHFFAGIGGWSHALRLAKWPDDRPIWTGSCPCQPFSVAGKRAGIDDPRHLWPHFHRLISANRPPVVMGEQVSGAAGYGWLDGVIADLESEAYASRGVDIPACAVDAPHIRQRLYWVAEALDNAAGARRAGDARSEQVGAARDKTRREGFTGRSGDGRDMDDAQQLGDRAEVGAAGDGAPQGDRPADQHSRRGGAPVQGDVADADKPVPSQGWEQRGGQQRGAGGDQDSRHSFWRTHIWLTGADGKARRAQPGIPLLAHGIPNRVGKLRAYGNAIVPPLAAEVIKAYMDVQP